MPLTNGGPQSRVSSPRGGGSTFTTFAPMSPSIMVQKGPERIRDRSSTNTSSSGVTRGELDHESGEGLLQQGFLQEPREHPTIDELERRFAGAVMAAAENHDVVRDMVLVERSHEILRQVDREREVVACVDEQRLS